MRPPETYDLVFPRGASAPTDYFTGQAWVHTLASDPAFHCLIGNVTFEPGARNYWHTHPGGQILLVTGGTGYYQEKGKAIRLIKKGDTILIPADVEHWHGATPDSAMTHIAISTNTQLGVVAWLRPVTDEEYGSYR
ncbi:MAG TPA: cupin domain-containing protein [Chitinophagaceae bacterium]|nr:cupin domain-containing protein [Chitinophagaceae bacterium]